MIGPNVFAWIIVCHAKNIGHTSIIVIIILVVVSCFRQELYDDAKIYPDNAVTENITVSKIVSVNKYNNGRSLYSYYVFTDKGRLLIDKEGLFSWNSDLYAEFEQKINATCTMQVYKSSWHTDYRVEKIITCS